MHSPDPPNGTDPLSNPPANSWVAAWSRRKCQRISGFPRNGGGDQRGINRHNRFTALRLQKKIRLERTPVGYEKNSPRQNSDEKLLTASAGRVDYADVVDSTTLPFILGAR